MGRRQKTLVKLEEDCILHIPHTLNDLLRSCIERDPVDFGAIKGYNDDNNNSDMFFLSKEQSENSKEIEIPEEKIKGFDILRNFKPNWTETTDVWCWWCIHSFNSTPIGIPLYRTEEFFKVKGCFCSFNCALAFNEDDLSKGGKRTESSYLIKSLYRVLTGKIFSDTIMKAPPREMLKVLGGPYNINQFRNKFNTFDCVRTVEYKKLSLPMISLNIQIEEDTKLTKPYSKPEKRTPSTLDDLRVSKATKSVRNNISKNNVAPVVKNFTKTRLSDFFKVQ